MPYTNPAGAVQPLDFTVTDPEKLAAAADAAQAEQHEAERFLRLLGKDPALTWCRTFAPGGRANARRAGRDLKGFDAETLKADNEEGAGVFFVTGDAERPSAKSGAIKDVDVTLCRAVFVEWDNEKLHWQRNAWIELGLPEPTAMVETGGKSIHCYWTLSEPMCPDEWRVLSSRLIAHAGGDPQCKNPARLLRLPGYLYIDKETGRPTEKRSALFSASGKVYTVAEVEACLPPVEETQSSTRPFLPPRPDQFPPRGIEEIKAAAACIPERVVGGNTYPESRNALCGCAAAFQELGETPERANELALELLAHKWPSFETARQVLESCTTRNAASFWAIARDHGFDLSRCDLSSGRQQGRDSTTPDGNARPWSVCLDEMLDAIVVGDEDAQIALRAEVIARFKRTDTQIEAALFRLHKRRQIKDTSVAPPASLDLSRISGMDWLLDGFVPDNDLTLIYGKAGAGKTTAGLALANAVLRGTGLLDHTHPAPRRGVLFIASDSGAPPLYAAMQDMGMAEMPEVHNGPDKRFHVWAADADQGMESWVADLKGCIRLLEFVRSHEIGLVLIDSCKAVCRHADQGYLDNSFVTSLLTYMKEVVCPHAAVVWLNHDGREKGESAGAKAWKEIPSVVHRIFCIENKDGSTTTNQRQWSLVKSRLGPTRQFTYTFRDGELVLSQAEEKVGNCLEQVVKELVGALIHEKKESLSRSDLTERICSRGTVSPKTLDNTLSNATRAKHPKVLRVPGKRGRYKLSPRFADSYISVEKEGKKIAQTPSAGREDTSSHQSSRQKFGNSPAIPPKFPWELNGKSPNASDRNGSAELPSPPTHPHSSEEKLLQPLELPLLPPKAPPRVPRREQALTPEQREQLAEFRRMASHDVMEKIASLVDELIQDPAFAECSVRIIHDYAHRARCRWPNGLRQLVLKHGKRAPMTGNGKQDLLVSSVIISLPFLTLPVPTDLAAFQQWAGLSTVLSDPLGEAA